MFIPVTLHRLSLLPNLRQKSITIVTDLLTDNYIRANLIVEY